MRYRKIHILGGPGSGKSSVAARVSSTYDIPAFDLDDIFWDNRAGGYGLMAEPDEREEALDAILERDSWIIEGAYCLWPLRSFEEADVIIILAASAWVRDWRIVRRFLMRKLGLVPRKKRETLWALVRLLWRNHRHYTRGLKHARAYFDLLERNVAECQTIDDVLAALEK